MAFVTFTGVCLVSDKVGMTISLVLAVIVAAIAGFLSAVRPEQWMPFYRAGIHTRSSKSNVMVTLFAGRMLQAVGSSFVGLLTTVFAYGIIGFSENYMAVWGGILTALLASVFFNRQRHSASYEPNRVDQLVKYASRIGTSPRPRPVDDPFGEFSGTIGASLQHAVFSPGFVVSPMFLAAAVSGLPSVTNAFSVVIVFTIAVIIGLVWSTQLINAGTLGDRYHALVRNGYRILAYATLLLGIVTAGAGLF